MIKHAQHLKVTSPFPMQLDKENLTNFNWKKSKHWSCTLRHL